MRDALAARGAFFAGFAAFTAVVPALMPFLAAFFDLPRPLGIAERVIAPGLATRTALGRFGFGGLGFAFVSHGNLPAVGISVNRMGEGLLPEPACVDGVPAAFTKCSAYLRELFAQRCRDQDEEKVYG